MSERPEAAPPTADLAAIAAKDATLALSTKVEEDFVSPLTAIRGALEILRDFPNLTPPERARFVASALSECATLERGVEHLAAAVYAAADPNAAAKQADAEATADKYAPRIRKLDDLDVIDIDFSDFEFTSAAVVNEFYDVVDNMVLDSRKHWYFIVNHRNSRVWPEAWVAFAHRGKKVHVSFSRGTVRYVEGGDPAQREEQVRKDPSMEPSRAAALAKVATLKAEPRRR